MSTHLKYSVIIPVYNAVHTIGRCLDSFLNQIPADAELLVVDDGSEDGSSELCGWYAESCPSIRFFRKENGGVSSARNLGLDHAEGEYILFADSDDYAEHNYWQVVDSLLEQQHPDMLQFGFRDCGKTVKARSTGDYVVTGNVAVASKINEAMRAYMFSALYARVYKRELIQRYQLRFDPNLAIGEDQAFTFSYALHINSLVSTSAILYNVVLDNTESLSRKKRDYLTEQLLAVNHMMFDTLEKAILSEEAKRIYRGAVAWAYYRSAYSACKELLKYELTARERRKKIREICILYSAEQIGTRDFKCKVIAFPIIHKMNRTIDALINQTK